MGPGQRKNTNGGFLIDEILHVLQNHGYIPVSVDEVRNMVARHRSGVTRDSVYNCLNKLERSRLVVKIKLCGGRFVWKASSNIMGSE